jgi:effector-binding domain-containing protein
MRYLLVVEVDRFTGYRYYEFHQLPRLYRILALKDLGFSLEEIGHLLEEDLSTEQMRGMLKLRQAEIRQRVEEEAERLERVDLWLRQIEQENNMSRYDVVIKKIEPIKVASVRGIVPTPPEQGPLWAELGSYLTQQHVRPSGPCFSLYHDKEYKERDWDIEVCEQIAEDLPATKQVKVHNLPGVETMACVIHTGPFATIGESYNAILKWLDENKYQIVGPCREIVLREPKPENSQNDSDTVVEIQYPVAKAG